MSLPRIFVSHSSKDNKFGFQLVADLQNILGSESAVWCDIRGGLSAGDEWWDKIRWELETRPIFIIILSPDSMTSKWVNTEITMAWQQLQTNPDKRIVPVLYRRCKVRNDLNTLQIIDFSVSYQKGLNKLLSELGLSNRHDLGLSNQQKKEDKLPLLDSLISWGFGLSGSGDRFYKQQIKKNTRKIARNSQNVAAYIERAEAYAYLEENQKALADYTKTIELDPQNASLYERRASFYSYPLMDDQKALADYTKAIELDPQNASLYQKRGHSYSRLFNYRSALEDYDTAIRLDSNNASFYYWRGKLYLDKYKNYPVENQKALEDFTQTISLCDKYHSELRYDAYIGRGEAYYSLKKYKKALADYDVALALKPDHWKAKEMREKAIKHL